MSEFIEVQAVNMVVNMDGPGKRMKDASVRTINREQVCSIDPTPVEGCVEVKMSDGQRIFVRGSLGSVSGLKPKPEPKLGSVREVPKPKTKGLSAKKRKW